MKRRLTGPSAGAAVPSGEGTHTAAHVPRRVHWMELFFDLVFIVFVGQLAHGIHGNPGWTEFGTFVLLFFPAWWAWVNLASVVNLLPHLSPRALGLAMLAAMAAAGVMAAAAPGAFGERAWAFSLSNSAMRVVLLVLWLYQHRGRSDEVPWRIWTYNGGTAVLWFVAAFLPLRSLWSFGPRRSSSRLAWWSSAGGCGPTGAWAASTSSMLPSVSAFSSSSSWGSPFSRSSPKCPIIGFRKRAWLAHGVS